MGELTQIISTSLLGEQHRTEGCGLVLGCPRGMGQLGQISSALEGPSRRLVGSTQAVLGASQGSGLVHVLAAHELREGGHPGP